MKISAVVASVVFSAVSLLSSGCAVFSKGRSQTVVVRTTPTDAVAKINGVEVGRTPFKVKLSRSEVYRLDFAKSGFSPQSAVLLPSSEEYDKRFLKWGLDYDLGAATDIIPGELAVVMKPSLGDISVADRFEEMAAQISRADAMLASGELSPADHKYLIAQIAATYHTSL